jgi:hypothetical protein
LRLAVFEHGLLQPELLQKNGGNVMAKGASEETVDVRYKFKLDDDDSGGPSGPDYEILTMAPRKGDLKNRILRQMDITIYLKEDVKTEVAERLEKLLNDNVSWIRFTLPRR